MRAADFAAWLLKDQPQWNRAAIDATIAAGQRHDISVTEKIPVAWIYLTAWITRDQIVQFRNDIYARDEQLRKPPRGSGILQPGAGHPLTAHMAQ